MPATAPIARTKASCQGATPAMDSQLGIQPQRLGTNRLRLHRHRSRNVLRTRGTSPSNKLAKRAKAVPPNTNTKLCKTRDVSQQQPAVRINARTTGSRKNPTATGQPQPEYNTGQGPKCSSGGTSASTTGRGGSTGSHSPALPALACFRAAASV